MAKAVKSSQRIAELVELIVRHKRAYYGGKPEISDAQYDKLEAELQKLAPQHPVLSMVGSDEAMTSEKVTHEVPMLSLQKTYELADLMSWKKDYDLLATYKIDGVSLSLLYEDGHLKMAKTRGNGLVGENVTEKVRWCGDVIPNLPAKGNCEIRGELHCSEANFFALSATMEKLQLEKPTSPRNIVAGVLGRKHYGDLTRYFSFLAFDLIFEGKKTGPSAIKSEEHKFELLADFGFAIPHPALLKSQKEIEEFIAQARDFSENQDTGLDGVVFTLNDMFAQQDMGNTSHHPRYKMVFKWAGETATSKINAINWATSRLGIVTPVASIAPVYLSGAEITNISLHNAAYVTNFNLKAGDEIELIRSGEVIPKFLRVITSAEGHSTLPTKCPSCSAKLEFDEVRLVCPNVETCPAQRIGTILNWIRNAGIDDLSEKRLQQMMDQDLVKDIPDLYLLSKEQLLTLPQTKEKLAVKLYKNIQASKSIKMENFLSGLGIGGMGSTSWIKILDHYPDFEKLWKVSAEDLVAIEGFAAKTAGQIVEGLHRTKPLAQKLLKVGVKPQAPTQPAVTNHPLSGKTIAITGTLSRPRGDVEADIKSVGAKPSSSVSKNTHAVVAADPNGSSSKLKDARKHDIPIWSEEKLQQELGL